MKVKWLNNDLYLVKLIINTTLQYSYLIYTKKMILLKYLQKLSSDLKM